jgi:hypothetical protein
MKQAKQLGLKGRDDKLARLRGFPIHLCVYVVVIAGLAAINLTKNPSHPWFLWVLIAWGIALAVHDVILLIKFPSPSNPNASAAPQACREERGIRLGIPSPH